MHWYIDVLKKYAVFSGRACRQEFWFFILFDFIIASILSLLFSIQVPVISTIFGVLVYVYSLGTIIPTIAVTVRRLHDINRNALSLFYLLIPLAGIIIFIVFMAKDGTHTEKKINKRWIVPSLILLAVIILAMTYYFSFKAVSSNEMFSIFNLSNNNYYLHVSTDKGRSQFSFKRNERINGIRYNYICKAGKYKLDWPILVFQCKRNNDDDIYIKLKSIFDEFKIVDEDNKVIWDLNDENKEEISKIAGFYNTVFWTLRIE